MEKKPEIILGCLSSPFTLIGFQEMAVFEGAFSNVYRSDLEEGLARFLRSS